VALWANLRRFFGGAGNTRIPGDQSGLPTTGAMVNQSVTFDTAMQISAVWSCVRLISETIASLPLNFYTVKDGARSLDNGSDIARVFLKRPNRYQSRVEFFESMTMQLVVDGNAYCTISRDSQGRVIGILPLMSAQMQVVLDANGGLIYTYNDGKGISALSEDSVWHVKLMGNGVVGLSPLAHARNAIGIAMANEKRVANQANNGFKPAGVLMIDKLLKPEQREQIRAQFADLSVGDGDPLRVLEAGMKYQQISMNPKDVQLLESRRFQLEDICRFFGVPSILVNDMSGTSVLGSGIHQVVQGFYKLTLRPYLERYEASIKRKFIPAEEFDSTDVEFDFRALLRGDDEARFKTYGEGVRGGIITPNEARSQEGLRPMDGGDKLYMQQQMMPIDAERVNQ
jgi:HK97 family phage portal protein